MMDEQAASRLVCLPTELLLRTTYFLTTPDLCSVRLSCKRIEEALFASFSREFFRKKQFMLSAPSLQALIDISSHPTLSPCLQHVIIGTDVFSDNETIPPNWSRAARLHHLAGVADQFSLINTGHGEKMLAQAFRNLANLETVEIRDFNAFRTRDGPGALWASYGSTTADRLTNNLVRMLDPHCPAYVSVVFSKLVAALADAGARPANLEIVIRDDSLGLVDHAFYVPQWLEPSLGPVLSSLKKLHLTLTLPSIWETDELAETGTCCFLGKFLAATPNLTWLRLNFKKSSDVRMEQLLTWLAKPVPEKTAVPLAPLAPAHPLALAGPDLDHPDPVRFPALEQLDLGNATVSRQTLLNLIAKFSPALQSLMLVRVILTDHQSSNGRDNMWATLFKLLAGKRKGSLRRFYVRQPRQRRPNSQGYALCPFIDEQGQHGRDRNYSGDYIGRFFEELAQSIVVSPQYPVESGFESNDDDASDSGDDDDSDDEEDEGVDEDTTQDGTIA